MNYTRRRAGKRVVGKHGWCWMQVRWLVHLSREEVNNGGTGGKHHLLLIKLASWDDVAF